MVSGSSDTLPSNNDVKDISCLTSEHSQYLSKFICQLDIKAHKESLTTIGSFTGKSPKGFSLEFTPEVDPESVVTQITGIGTQDNYRFMLFVSNYGNEPVHIEVRQL